MTQDLEDKAKIYQEQRAEIERFVRGDSGDDLEKFITTVADATKMVRDAVAHAFSGEPGIKVAQYESISSILSREREHPEASRSPSKMRFYEGVSKTFAAFMRGNASFVPEVLDGIPATVAKLAADKEPLTDEERRKLVNLSKLEEAKYFLVEAIKIHEQNNHGIISPEIAKAAHTALEVLNRNLLPSLDKTSVGNNRLFDEMRIFAKDYAVRHGNAKYVEFINELQGKKPKGRRKITGGHVAAALAGALVGGGAVEGYHRFTDATTDSSHVRTYDPEQDKPAYRKALNIERSQTNSEEVRSH
jgi:hypothetical protein